LKTARAVPIHYAFLSRAIPIYEELFNMDSLLERPETDAMYFTGVPLSIQDGDGMLVRLVEVWAEADLGGFVQQRLAVK
jgi:kynurenine formamidase